MKSFSGYKTLCFRYQKPAEREMEAGAWEEEAEQGGERREGRKAERKG